MIEVIFLDICIGSIVTSKAGRDKGRSFIVVCTEGDYAYLCDGDLRKSDSPKKKKHKHLAVTNTVCDYIGDKIRENKKVTNTEIRRALSEFLEKNKIN